MRIRWLSVIRVVGMAMVLLYHFQSEIFRGGFLGVDLFLAVSGFLTTALFLEEFGRNKAIDLIGFYRRRLYRLLPPLVFMVIVTVPLTLLIRSDFRAGLASQLAAVFSFVTNYFEIALGSSYESQFVPHLFRHTWTLGVEVQLYLVWGLLLFGVSKVVKSSGQFRLVVLVASLLGFGVFFVNLILGSLSTSQLSSVYYATGKHGFPFFLGSLLACFVGLNYVNSTLKRVFHRWHGRRFIGLFLSGLVTLVILMFSLRFDNLWTYWLGFLLATLATLVMIVAVRWLHDKYPDNVEPTILSYLANISYGIYLFHWPFFVIFSELSSRGLAIGLSLVFSVLLASLSFYIIEPLVAGKDSRLFGVKLTFSNVPRTLGIVLLSSSLLVMMICFFSPRIAPLEQDLMIKGLEQADIKMSQLRSQVDGQQASDYGVVSGTMVIGDSVALRATDGIIASIPGVLVDGEVSRTLTGTHELLLAQIEAKTLPETVVIAAGANTINDYQEQLNAIVNDLPKGHRLILVTPYDGRVAGDPGAIVNLTRSYELTLAEQYDWITIADWYQVATDNPQLWYYTDYVHFGSDSESILAGQALYGQLLANALTEATSKSVKP